MAAKVSTKRRDAEQSTDIMTFLAGENQEGDEGNAPEKKPVDVDALMAQISSLTTRVEQAERTNTALLSTPMQGSTNNTSQVQNTQQEELPDPSLDPKGYADALRRQITQSIQAQQNQENEAKRTTQVLEDRTKQLWSDFNSRFEDYAEDPEKVEYVAAKVANRAKSRGLDAEKYVFASSDQFFNDVVKEYNKVFGEPDAKDENDVSDVQQPPRKARKSQPADDDDNATDNRTAGIFGGLESGNRPVPGGTPKDGDMIKDLQDMQRKSGYF